MTPPDISQIFINQCPVLNRPTLRGAVHMQRKDFVMPSRANTLVEKIMNS
jgi:hypothetical protein